MHRFRFAALALLFALPAARLAAQPATLPKVWELATPGALPQAILPDRRGRDALFVALKNGGLAILDVSRPASPPARLATVGIGKLGNLHVMNLAQQGNRLYLALGDLFSALGSPAGLGVVDVSDLRRPRVLGLWKSATPLHGAAAVVVRDRWAWLAAMRHGVFVLDVAQPAKIRKVAALLPDPNFPRPNPTGTQLPNARGLALAGDTLWVAFDAGGLRAVDVAHPLAPREIGRYANAGMGTKQQAYNNLVLDGTIAYVAVDYAGVEVLDVGDPRAIRPLAWWNPWRADLLTNLWLNSPGHTNQLALDAAERRLYLSAGDSDLQVLDVADPANPALVALHGAPQDGRGAWGVAIAPGRVYLADITAFVPFRGTWAGVEALAR